MIHGIAQEQGEVPSGTENEKKNQTNKMTMVGNNN